jgi:hypothetical protein
MKYLSTPTIILTLIIITVGGCNFLNESPTGHLSTSNFYKSASDAQLAINAVYRQAKRVAYFQYPKGLGAMMSNNADKGGGGAGDQAELLRLKQFTAAPSNTKVENTWSFNYKGVYLANLVLAKVPDIKMNSQQKAGILAQARFWRGYYYLQLVRWFGNIPLVKKPLKNGDYNQPQVKPGKIWNFIVQQEDSAMKNLPVRSALPVDSSGKVTRGAAMALKLNALMWQKKWSQAEKLGNKIISSGQYSLAPDYDHIWTLKGKHGPGSIFEINMAIKPGKNLGNVIAMFASPRQTANGDGFIVPTQNLVNTFEKGDPRLKATVIKNNEVIDGDTVSTDLSPTGYYSRKFWLPPNEMPAQNGGSWRDDPVNLRIYRLSQIMLWDAEASVHNGDIANATKLVNKVRARARKSGGNTDMSILPPYSAVTLQEVYHEERVESAVGALRAFYRLVRTGQAATVLTGYKKGINNHFPIPQTEIDLSNGKLQQNPGYH